MQVTDEQVEVLRSYLADDPDVWLPKHERLLESGDVAGYEALAHAAFATAVHQRFSPTWTRAAVIRFVADVRIRLAEDADQIDTRAAEDLIRRALEDTSLDSRFFEGVSQEVLARSCLILLTALIEDANFDAIALDEFISSIRSVVTQS